MKNWHNAVNGNPTGKARGRMQSSIKEVVARANVTWMCLTVLGLACCLISLGTFDGSISSFTDADFFGVRISTEPLSGGLPIVISCAVVAFFCRARRCALAASRGLCIGLAVASVAGLVLLFLNTDGMVPRWASEFGGALLTFAGISALALWVQILAGQGIAAVLICLGFAFVLETVIDLLVENALVDIAAMVVLAVVVAGSPLLAMRVSAIPAVRVSNADETDACQPKKVPALSSGLAPVLSIACIFVWGLLMGRVQGMGSGSDDASLFLSFIKDNAVGLSALAVAALCLAAASVRFAFIAARITILAMLVCSLYFSGTFGPGSIPMGMLTMGVARMAAFVYMWMLACDALAHSRSTGGGQNASAFIVVIGWGVFTLANTLSTKLGLLIPAGGIAFLVYNVVIMVCLAGLIVVEFVPKKSAETALAGQDSQAGAAAPAPTSEELLSVQCAQLAERYGLTEREREVLVPLVRGRSASSIGSQLSMSTETARTHIRHIYQKIDIHSREELMDIVDGM